MGNIVYFNGEYMEASEVKISMYDRGFMWGDSVYDILRTVKHVPFKLKEHIDRLYRSLNYARIDCRLTPQEMTEITLEVIKRNEPNWAPDDEYAVGQTITRGESPALSIDPKADIKPTVLISCNRIAFESFARKYTEGVHLLESTVRHVPAPCLDPRAKIRSRLANVLADLEVKTADPAAFALMTDISGFLSEGTTFNFFIVRDGRLITSRGSDVLEGITRGTVIGLAKRIGIEYYETDLTAYDVQNADEVIVTATSYEILPVSKVNHKPLKGPFPGPVTRRLLEALSEEAGVDIVQHAMSHLK